MQNSKGEHDKKKKKKKKKITTVQRQHPNPTSQHANGLENEVKVSHKGSVRQNRDIF